ncbi:MAG: heme-binding protein [Xanthobacteraceae bacterium]|nr:heme-binding protein [Xanthobacteraceae bacterium]MBV9630417.1 heme-binding protein [Xanthobacteraceae bacterium]
MTRFRASAPVASIVLLTSVTVVPAEPLPTETFKILPAALAVEAAQAAVASCKQQGYVISVSIVDRVGNPKLLLVGDGASALSRRLSRRKAYTAAVRRISTGELAKQVAAPGAFNPTLYDTQLVTATGGLPIKAGDETIGAIGVSGAPGGDKDEACANAGLAKISDRLN